MIRLVFIFLIAPSVFANTLVTSEMSEKERLAKLKPFIFPPPGSELEVQPKPNVSKKDDLFLFSGKVEFNPPKGICFTVMRDAAKDDDVICKRKTLNFTLQHLDRGGKLMWNIKTGAKDFGHDYFWNTRYRIAQVIPILTDKKEYIPVDKCTPHYKAGETRRLILELLNGDRWTLDFPMADVAVKIQNNERPTLAGKKHDEPKEEHAEATPAPEPTPEGPKIHWVIPERNSFEMSASAFKSTYSPPGMKGRCRYQYEGFPGDKATGWVECHEVDRFETILVPLTCIKYIQ